MSVRNIEYLKERLGLSPSKNPSAFNEALQRMKCYPTDWWNGSRRNVDSLIEMAEVQLDEPCLLIEWRYFKKGVEALLGRKVSDDELHSTNKALIDECHRRYRELKK